MVLWYFIRVGTAVFVILKIGGYPQSKWIDSEYHCLS